MESTLRTRGPVVCGVVLVLAALALYVVTLAPTVLFGDSAEFQYVAHVWGLPHPTGYPTYVYASKLFTLLPFGEVAWRVNLLSAVCGALAVGVLYALLRRLDVGVVGALSGAAALTVGEVFWSQAVVAEVHTLNILLLLAALWLALRFEERGGVGTLMLLAVVAGVCVGNHATGSLLLPCIAVFVLSRGGAWRRVGTMLGALAVTCVIALLLYAYLPVRTLQMAGQPLSALWRWSTVELTLNYVSGRQFESLLWAYGWGDQPARLGFWFGESLGQVGWAGLLLALLGLVGGRLPASRRALLGGAWAAAGLIGMNLGPVDGYLYLLPAHALVAVFLGLGAEVLWRHATRSRAARIPVALGLAALPLWLAFTNFGANDRSDDHAAGTWGRRVLAEVEPGATILVEWQRGSALNYLRLVEGRRGDVTLAYLGGLPPGVVEDAARTGRLYLAGNPDQLVGEVTVAPRQPGEELWHVLPR